MKLGVFSPVLASMTLEDSLKYLKGLGAEQLELGCGGFPGTAHADAKKLVKDKGAAEKLAETFEKYGIEISALSAHGNCVHPDPKTAAAAEADFEAACKLAGMLGVERVVTFSGCPGDGSSKKPNWVTCAWPQDYADILQYQWEEVLIPYWKGAAKYAADCGVRMVCLEMHPGFCVYNPETMLRLRDACGKVLGANLDPSHLLWQGIDICEAIAFLGEAVYFFHAKDTELHAANVRKNGVLDTKPYGDEAARSWIFRTVGYGEADWKRIFSALRMAGYDGPVSIEHEDSLMTPKEGLEKAVAYLKEVLIREKNDTEMWWA